MSNFPPPVHVLNKIEALQPYSLEIHFNVIYGPDLFTFHTFHMPNRMSNSHFYIIPNDQSSPRLCETFSNAVSCYDIELLATHSTNYLEDTPYRLSSNTYSVYYQLPSTSRDHLFHRYLRVGGNLMTKKHSVRLMIPSNYHGNF